MDAMSDAVIPDVEISVRQRDIDDPLVFWGMGAFITLKWIF